LIDGAMRLLDEVGIAEFTMRGLAGQMGQSPMAAYKHFSNQRELQLELWRACQNHFYDELLESTERSADSANAFLALCQTFMEYAVEFPYRYELLYSHPFSREAEQIPALAEPSRFVWSYAHELVCRAQREGTLRTDVSSEVVLAAAASQARGLGTTPLFAAPSPFQSLSPELLIESGLVFIRSAVAPR
jgi:AcrR family transcriptional regulator